MDIVTLGASKMYTDRTLRLVGFDTRVFGALWDKGSDPTLIRTDDAVGKIANVGVDDEVVQNDFDGLPIFGEMREVVDPYGNVFIRIPKFYIRKQDEVNFKSWQVSKTQYPGFYLPWCFWDFKNSRELPYLDVGKYKASLDGDKLESKSGIAPLAYKNIVQFRDYAQNNNINGLRGYQQLDIHVVDVLRTLMFIEFATLDMQSVMSGYTVGRYGVETELAAKTEENTNRIIVSNATAAQYRIRQTISVGTARYGVQVFYGRTVTSIEDYDAENKAIYFDGEPVNIAEGNFLMNSGAVSGFSSQITASSGSIGDNTSGKYPCVYRGIESPYGDMWQWADGVNIDDNQSWVCKNAENYTSNVFASPYEKLSYINSAENGYPTAMGYDNDLPFAEFSVALGASPATYYCDYYYQAAGQRVARFGGSWAYGAPAGPSCWVLDFSSSNVGVAVGGRLLKKPL